jgi:hypothetical protein
MCGRRVILDNVNTRYRRSEGELWRQRQPDAEERVPCRCQYRGTSLIDSPNAVQNTGTPAASNTTAGNGGLVLRVTRSTTPAVPMPV